MAVQVFVLCEMNKVSCVGYTEEFTRCLSEDTLVDNLGVWHPEMPKELVLIWAWKETYPLFPHPLSNL